MPSKNKRLRIMAGPNGSGKSTILQEVREQFYSGPFVNADEIEQLLKAEHLVNLPSLYDLKIDDETFSSFVKNEGASWIDKAVAERSSISIKSANGMLTVDAEPSPYDAAITADFVRRQLLQKGETFTFETVLSHPSKINFLHESQQTGYKNYLYFICTVDPAINIERVRQRVELGGHAVPEDKIIKRYNQSLEVLSQIIPLCHRAFLFDNSTEERSIEPVAEIDHLKRFIVKSENMPWWIDEFVVDKLYRE